ncbi:MAG: hypothetical protein QNK19_10020 [Xanthomonadales bacterium]|nr:hypothetical protein [Xanthomonadales bacterium]
MEKYLRNYAEPEVLALEGLPDQLAWENVMVIPACNESPGLLRSPPPCGGRSLMILVINEPQNAAEKVSPRNRALEAAVEERFALLWRSAHDPGLSLWRDPCAGRDLLLVDRFSEGRHLAARGGVGFARKIGADLALDLIHHQRIHTTWIHCTDADVQLPATYFARSNRLQDDASKISALIYPFSHSDDQDKSESREVVLATLLYELSLRYYVAGMKHARSPYAFHTIGSTMAVNAIHYAKVRGFPKREAGEDFYLLNKLAKVGSVLELGEDADNQAIEIESRRSDRVPFGTGAAVNKITGLANPVNDFRFYNPVVFELLKLWLQSFPTVWASGSTELSPSIFPDQQMENRDHKLQMLLTGLKTLKTDQALVHAFRQSRNLDQFTRQMHTWFDAFRTLKLIHFLRDIDFPSIPYARLVVNPVYQHLLIQETDLLAFHEHLRKNLATDPINRERLSVTSPDTDHQ